MELKTVRIKDDGRRGFLVINESDYDPTRHALYEEPSAAAGLPAPDASTAAPPPGTFDDYDEVPPPVGESPVVTSSEAPAPEAVVDETPAEDTPAETPASDASDPALDAIEQELAARGVGGKKRGGAK